MNDKSGRIRKDFGSLKRAARRVARLITSTTETLMATVEDLQAKIDELDQAVKDDEASDAQVVATLNQTIADLRAQVDANQPIDTQPLIDRLEAIKAELVPADGPSDSGTPS